MKILSIDWDYFFPCSDFYDWGANEENSLFFEFVWSTRCNTRNMISTKFALDEYKPTIPENFWSIVKNKPSLYIADSHLFILHVIRAIMFSHGIIHNLDAHHDYSYEAKDKIDCGNWGKYVLNESEIADELHLHYPKWRQKQKETDEAIPITSVNYKLPEPQDYDAVFLCRSSCWTPPWYDEKFDEFWTSSRLEPEILDERLIIPRSPNMQDAMKIRDKMEYTLLQLMEKNNVK
jgi:hypothetical protein